LNEIRLSGVLVERAALRYTPAGVPVVEAQIRHCSEVIEAAAPRTLEFVVGAIALGPVAVELERAALGATLRLSGFLAPRSRRSGRLVMHVTRYENEGIDRSR
jgi:primosomal replication protein N